MKKEVRLKTFGTGQITIPKEWRDFFGTNEFRAVLDEKTNEIKIQPVKFVEIDSEQKWFWDEKWQKKEDEALTDIKTGKVKKYNKSDDLITELKDLL